ncbi:selenide, water dikinase SelD [Palleronia sp. LCG004]|uniref:selenide, water dikinase SelD n=1 Tax=Palleronia sp. LCG004 TaxID=3079304 RepID=UPI0029420A1D|nr:selenide, water dikinase SelD [Palleronia sp. LCG004]WOI55047.1 selenide, water dikinase SelD [Palleronia sp. LCG004]
MRQIWPATRDLVLVGGGHAHALVLRSWGMDPLPGARLTLINPGPTAPYTGMLPGFVAGHYDRDTLDIDLMKLAQFAGARIVLGHATGIDRAAKEIEVEDQLLGSRRVAYDVASIDIGIHSDMPEITGFSEYGAPAKPLDRFASLWAAHVTGPDRNAPKAVIGGGPAGAELAMAMSYGTDGAPVTLIDRGRAFDDMGQGAAHALRAALVRRNVTLIEQAEVAEITAHHVVLKDGGDIPARLVTAATGPRPHAWIGRTGLSLSDGYIDVDAELRSSDPAIFAAGDCAHMTFAPRPKAGVFAVRQAPILRANLRASMGAGRLRRFRPQSDYLKLIALGEKSAVADKFGLRLSGRAIWWWKDRIDRRFMRRLSDLPVMEPDPPPRHHTEGLRAMTRQIPCGGCAAKVGPEILKTALGPTRDLQEGVETGIGDDAAILRTGGVRQAITVDQIGGISADPRLMAHIAAHHAIGDCLAMGARPQAILPILTLPRAAPEMEARTLAEVADAVEAVATAAGAAIVGGHTATGAEMAMGFAVTGLLDGPAITLAGARPGDALILTKPLGSGVILAGAMAGRCRGVDLAAALRHMATPQIAAASILSRAHAMTDVTGFGLAGHLMGMLRAAQAGARLDAKRIPAMDGAIALFQGGQRSTLHAANRQAVARETLGEGAVYELLFDPQTAGGLLAAIAPEEAEETLARLERAGYPAARIGTVTAGAAVIELT